MWNRSGQFLSDNLHFAGHHFWTYANSFVGHITFYRKGVILGK